MISERDKFDLIHNYLTGQMPAAEREKFSHQIASDPGLAEEIKIHEAAHELIVDYRLIGLKAKMQHIYESDFKNETPVQPTRIINMRTGLLAAGLAASVAIATWYGTSSRYVKNNNSELVASHVANKPGDGIVPEKEANRPASETEKPIVKGAIETNITKNGKVVSEAGSHSPSSQTQNPPVSPVTEKPLQTPVPDLSKPAYNGPSVANPEIKATKPIIQEGTKNRDGNNLIDNCKNLRIIASVHPEYSCEDRPTGLIIIDPSTIDGGQAPYTYSLSKGKWQAEPKFDNLSAGSYSVSIRDANGCTTVLPETEVISRRCEKPNTYTFAPARETLQIPTKEVNGTIKIMTKTGLIIFSGNLDGGTTFTWDGHSNQGYETDMGLYPFLIQYSDGSVIQGNITMVR